MTPYPTTGIITATDLATSPDVFPMLAGRGFLEGKAPEFSTGVRKSASGREIRTGYYSAPRWTFKVRHEFLRDLADNPDVGKLLAFFMSRMGRLGSFFYYDESDHLADDELFGVGDGATKTFQLTRTVGKGTPYGYVEPVQCVWKAPTVKVAGVTKTYGTDYQVEPWGRVTFATAPADDAEVRWSGDFLFVCRFEDDRLDLQQLVRSLWSQDGLEFVSLKP